mmetsp:Transcript_27822/g.70456  ORF Transcript_27822/g.70456 Transcript_27822/m.70456 type:complete len:136 (+) Transcript_27822:86-493(+)|eukprot:CAMPEP_0183432262 /NCGR_PEP_ID=MMETSP0370-20130417/56667_1 /TAXON_ID=268820 /ORGANISM="Peridinium aciculiferum, Strain PAER-2" /LENGTH=135 /DNA_ID=CAMNT_0025618179 /DNA_START=72 /DNA_END=479 /DNA_ORIENTATION=+
MVAMKATKAGGPGGSRPVAKAKAKVVKAVKAKGKAVPKQTAKAAVPATGGALAGKVLCFGINLKMRPRSVVSAAAIAAGAKVSKFLTKNTDIMVVGENSPPAAMYLQGTSTGPHLQWWTEQQFREAVKPHFALPE